ncbi:hypothetical protein B0J13DRAFT_519430 [Dactylonectria estremocensis]|uniref:Uncharacterized protein n=1 Tax=Dactylonectria estremocensis TaxID=1079267 RepID=A0A9P9FDV2_9HYPO|nr:hypothetical protein B0J13DRAFT_519430 [Dactylonectria estremocensis]
MAPHSNADSSYYRSAILSNSRFFLGPGAEVDVVGERDSSRVWHMHVVKMEAGERTKVLTGTAANHQDALRLLYETSAQAVNRYVSTNGFGLPPTISDSPKRRTNRVNCRGGEPNAMSISEVIALHGSSSEEEEEEESDSDGSRKGRTNKRGRRQRRNRRVAGEAVSATYSCSDNDDDDHDNDDDTDVAEVVEEPSHRRRHVAPPPWYPPGPGPSQPAPRGRMPAAGWNAFPAGPPVTHPDPLGRRPQPAGPVLGPLPQNVLDRCSIGLPVNVVNRSPISLRPVPVLLNINWTGRGCKNMLGQVAPSGDALRTMALKEVCMRPTGFVPAAPGMPLPPFTQPDFVNLRAVIRRMTLGADVYEVASFGDDLSPLFRTSAGIPKFDIEVSKVMMPVPRRRANSVSSANSDDDITK